MDFFSCIKLTSFNTSITLSTMTPLQLLDMEGPLAIEQTSYSPIPCPNFLTNIFYSGFIFHL